MTKVSGFARGAFGLLGLCLTEVNLFVFLLILAVKVSPRFPFSFLSTRPAFTEFKCFSELIPLKACRDVHRVWVYFGLLCDQPPP